jgi:flagellar hook-basal body complex protein FliE
MNDSIMKMMEQDFAETLSSSVERVDHNGVKSIATLAASIRDKERDVRVMEDTLKEAKKQLLKLTDEDLPSLMQEIGI